MTPDQHKELSRELCKRWPQKFNASDLAYWHRALDAYQLGDVIEALTKFRNSSRYTPKPKEIRDLLPRLIGDESTMTARLEGSHADVLRRRIPNYKGRCDAEVYLRHWRGLYIKRAAELKIDGRSVEVVAAEERALRNYVANKCRHELLEVEGWDLGAANRAIAFIFEGPEMFRVMLDQLRETVPLPEESEESCPF